MDEKSADAHVPLGFVDDGDIDILDAALDAVLQTQDPLQLPDDVLFVDVDQSTSLTDAPSLDTHGSSGVFEFLQEDVPGADKDAPKRRGRKPAAKLTKAEAKEKERKIARESQRRFRARQKNVIAELEDRVEILKPQLEQEKQQNMALSTKNGVMENLLVFKDSQVALLDDIGRANGARTIEDRIYPGMLRMMQTYSYKGVYNLEKLLRFAPAGYTDHLDDDIFAIQAAPLGAYIDAWRTEITKVRAVLAEARRGNNNPTQLTTDPDDFAQMTKMMASLNVHLEAVKKDEKFSHLLDPEGGTSLEYAGIKYVVTKEMTERMARRVINMGCILWSMGVFFPERMMEFSILNMESSQSAATSSEYNDIDRWLNVIRLVGLRQEQLEYYAREHYQYLLVVRPVMRERATIMQHLMQAASRQTDTIKDHIEATADLGDCTSALEEIVRKEYVAWVDFMAKVVVDGLDYPVQRLLMFSLSWPYMPNPNLVGAAAALELGLNPFEYQFNESDFEKAPFLRSISQE